MPELPEVETIRRGLEKRLIGRKLTDVEILSPKSAIGNMQEVVGCRIIEVDRRAKVLRLSFEKELNLLFHLKMTGQLIYRHREDRLAGGHPTHDWHADLPNKSTRIIFDFDDQSRLFFNDMRKFGWCKVATDKEVEALFTAEYGPEPLSSGFSTKYLHDLGKRLPNRPIKQLIMDQSLIAGIGNIYADESLFMARISPLRRAGEVSEVEWRRLYDSIIEVLEMGIAYGGTTDRDYVDSEGQKGGMQDHLKVYRRTGLPCIGCDGEVVRVKVGGRGTHYCPACQK